MTNQPANLTLPLLNMVSEGLRDDELAVKRERIQGFMDSHGLDTLVLHRHENLAWATAGQVESRVGIPSENAVATLLLRRDGQRFYLAPANEAPRLAAEEFTSLGYEPVLYPWWESSAEPIAKLAGTGLIASDALGAYPVVDLGSLRAPLLPAEVLRYRWLGRETAAVVADVVLGLEPGVDEYEMQARVSEPLLRKGIFPTVLLMAVDERILNYKHAVPRGAKLERFGMVNLCTRKWGLAISITRFVHFGPPPSELANGFRIAEQVNAALLDASKPGASSAELYAVAANAYAAAGAPGEEVLHHQGGTAGYSERGWLATPSGTQKLTAIEAVAWNPSARGGKVEDTVIVSGETQETLTATPSLPTVETVLSGRTYVSAGILVR